MYFIYINRIVKQQRVKTKQKVFQSLVPVIMERAI